MNFIELHGYFTGDDIDYESLGLPDTSEPDEIPTLVNVDNITEINKSEKGTTIEFTSGERYLFADRYEHVKLMIQELCKS